MRRRVLLVPAAGRGSRLGGTVPKLLVPVGGMPMIDRILDLYAGSVAGAIVVVHPTAETEVRGHVSGRDLTVRTLVQPAPTGMLDAIVLAREAARGFEPTAVWITWCDQVAIHPWTVRHLAEMQEEHPEAPLVLPTVRRLDPYIHLQRDADGRIERVLHRREGDVMPARGESDMGLFGLTARAFFEMLPEFARHVEAGSATRERNFLPFIPWIAARAPVMTFPAVDPMEAVGVNTPEERQEIERYLAARDARR